MMDFIAYALIKSMNVNFLSQDSQKFKAEEEEVK